MFKFRSPDYLEIVHKAATAMAQTSLSPETRINTYKKARSEIVKNGDNDARKELNKLSLGIVALQLKREKEALASGCEQKLNTVLKMNKLLSEATCSRRLRASESKIMKALDELGREIESEQSIATNIKEVILENISPKPLNNGLSSAFSTSPRYRKGASPVTNSDVAWTTDSISI